MAHDSTITDAWLNAPLDHGRERARALRPQKSNRLVFVGIAAAICAGAILALAIFGWKGGFADLPGRGTTPTRAPPSERQTPEPPRPKAAEPSAPVRQGGRTTRVTKCMSAIGAPTTFSDGPCPPGTRNDVLVVQPDLNLADGMSSAQRSESIRDSRLKAQATVEYEQRPSAPSSATSSLCAQLDAQIDALDAEARQPLPGWRQDQIREVRKTARDRQFALRCT